MSDNQILKTVYEEGNGLKIPVIDVSLDNKLLSEPEVLRDSLLLELFENPQELESLVIVKLDPNKGKDKTDEREQKKAYLEQLKRIKFEDKVNRDIVFASGRNVYFGDRELVNKIRQEFFNTQPDHACRYGSLLVSSCLQGCATFNYHNDGKPIRIKIVDRESNNPIEREEAAKFHVGDCHGKIAPRLVQQIGGELYKTEHKNCPFQFRLAWNKDWQNPNLQSTTPASFLAKGTLLPNYNLTEKQGYDLVLDRSSIKGIVKNQSPFTITLKDNIWQLSIEQDNPLAKQLNRLLKEHEIDFNVTKERENQLFDFKLNNPSQADIETIEQEFGSWGIDKLVPCGDYELPQIIIGNRAYAEEQKYDNSWQFLTWFSKEAIEKDIVPATQLEALKLAAISQDSLALNQYIVEKYDRTFKLAFSDEELAQNLEDNNEHDRDTAIMSLLRNDKLGLLDQYPKIVEFKREQLRKSWLELATKGAVKLDTAMAQPCENLHKGTIVAPHLQQGEEVIVTRYPIVCKDNIRRYTVDNHQPAALSLQHYRNCVFIRPDQAMQHHQCDFDGDQLVVTPTSKMPNIAREIRHANQENEFLSIVKRQKTDYAPPQFNSLRQVAAAVRDNSIGYIATAIGRVASHQLNKLDKIYSSEELEKYNKTKEKLLSNLFDALQIEVDSPKSANRFKDFYPKLDRAIYKWNAKFPANFFDFKKDERLYRTATLPTDNSHICCLAELAVNPIWQESKLRMKELENFNYLFQPPTSEKHREYWLKKCIPWAEDLKIRYSDRSREILTSNKSDKDSIKEQFARLYEDLKVEVENNFNSPLKKKLACSALGYISTKKSDWKYRHEKASRELSRNLEITFTFKPNHTFENSLVERSAWVLSIPFERVKQGNLEKLADSFKKKLDDANIKYEATIDSDLPLVNFALIAPSAKVILQLEERFANNTNEHYLKNRPKVKHPHTSKSEPLKVIATDDYYWAGKNEAGINKGSLVLNLFAKEISEHLQNFQFDRVTLVGKKYNHWKDTDFNDSRIKNKKFEFKVVSSNLENTQYQGRAIVTLKDKTLGMFSAD
jgi:hypothetical protein